MLRERIAISASKAKGRPLFGSEIFNIRLKDGFAHSGPIREELSTVVRRAGRGRPMMQMASNNPHGAPPLVGPTLVRLGKPLMLGGSRLKDRMQFAHGAQFVEVRVNRWTGEIRVPRMVGVFAAGRIMNERTARSQLMGGQIWGLSSALLESSEIDPGARYVNDDLAEYHIPVNADARSIKTVIVDETDTLINPLGIKGVGELGITGVAAAVANAVHHATGVRVRKLPIRSGTLLQSEVVQ
jgi:xanthine dehydrogenase YagR molybdenum-binding subunit